MPQWEDLSQWMKVTTATVICHEWELLTFNINLHPDLESKLVVDGNVRSRLAERLRKQLGKEIGLGREYFFVIEGHNSGNGAQTYLHMHSAIALNDLSERAQIKNALARAAGQGVRGGVRIPRSVHTAKFETVRAAYMNYLFKFALRLDPRLDERRLVMSNSMTQAARDFWHNIARGELSSVLLLNHLLNSGNFSP